MKLKDLTQDYFLEKMKEAKIKPGTRIQFLGSTPSKLDIWKTYYFIKFADIEGKKESGAVLSPRKNLKTVDNNGQYIGFYYRHGKVKRGGRMGMRPNQYNLTDIMDMKIG